jgi:hypothetical protein
MTAIYETDALPESFTFQDGIMHIINIDGGEQLPNENQPGGRFTITPLRQSSNGFWTVSIACGPLAFTAMIHTDTDGAPVVRVPKWYDLNDRTPSGWQSITEGGGTASIDGQFIPDLMRAAAVWYYDNAAQEFTKQAQRIAERRRAALDRYAPDHMAERP